LSKRHVEARGQSIVNPSHREKGRLSVVIIAYNDAKNLAETIKSISGLAEEIIVVDSGSKDNTIEVAKSLGARVFSREFDGFGTQKQYAVDQAKGSWILSIDTDERVTRELFEEIKTILWIDPPFDGYRIAIRNIYLGKALRFGGKYPDYHVRLFRHDKGAFDGRSVHESIRVKGRLGKLKFPIEHLAYPSVNQMLHKAGRYGRMRAENLFRRGSKPSVFLAIKFLLWRPTSRFLRRYIFKLGFLDGFPGLFACLHDSATECLTYLYLWELARNNHE